MRGKDDQLSFATNKRNIIKFKIVFVGDQSTGKSSIINRFIKNQFEESHNATVGIDFVSKNINVGDKTLRLQLWDTAGQQRFRSLIPNYLRDSQVAFIVYDLTNEQSFEAVSRWVDFIKQFRGQQDVLIFAVGNKKDLDDTRVVSKQQAEQKFKQLGIKNFEVSAKTGEGLNEIFLHACEALMKTSLGQTKTIFTPKPLQKNERLMNQDQKKQTYMEKPIINSRNQSQRLTKAKTQTTIIRQKNCC